MDSSVADRNDLENPDSPNEEIDLDAMREHREQTDRRRQEWGFQFDVWLIRNAKKNRPVNVILSRPLPGVTESELFTAVPTRIDQFYVQFDINGKLPWINKSLIDACLPVEQQPPADDAVEQKIETKPSSKKKKT